MLADVFMVPKKTMNTTGILTGVPIDYSNYRTIDTLTVLFGNASNTTVGTGSNPLETISGALTGLVL